MAQARARTSAQNYVDNAQLFSALVEYRAAVDAARKARHEPPPVPDYVGECILRIATRLATKHNFASYTFREDMVSDAVENCLLYLYNFDPAKSSNPFAYFTQIAYYAFLRRIKREKDQTYIKLKYAMHQSQQHLDYVNAEGEHVILSDPSWLRYENYLEFVRAYEAKAPRTRTATDQEDAVPEDVISFDHFDGDEDEESTDEDIPVPSIDDPREL